MEKGKNDIRPIKEILTFLREEFISNNILDNDLKFVNKKDMYGNWQVKREMSFRPFHTKDINPILKAVPNVMNHNLHHLLIKDFMMLNAGDKVICLLCSDHIFLTDTGPKKQWIPLLKEVMAIEPLHPVQYQNSIFFPFSILVRNNPTRYTIKQRRRWKYDNFARVLG